MTSRDPSSTVNRVLPSVIAFLLLATTLILFRKPATTFASLEEIAIHASVLSLSDPAWPGSCWIRDGLEPPIPGSVAFGKHDLYPFRLITARDVHTGDVLVRIISPLTIPSEASTVSNLRFTSFVHDSEALVLLRRQNSESWPVSLFSIITMERH